MLGCLFGPLSFFISVARNPHDTFVAKHNTSNADDDISDEKKNLSVAKHVISVAEHALSVAKHDMSVAKHDISVATRDISVADHVISVTQHDTTFVVALAFVVFVVPCVYCTGTAHMHWLFASASHVRLIIDHGCVFGHSKSEPRVGNMRKNIRRNRYFG